MIHVHTFTVGYIETNMYLVAGEEHGAKGKGKDRGQGTGGRGQGIVIDPGFARQEADEIIAALEHEVAEIPAIIITHGHFDHTSGLRMLKDRFRSKIYCHELEREKLVDPEKSGAVLFGFKGDSIEPDMLLKGGEELGFGDMTCSIIHTPGHSQGGISVLVDGKYLFSGDLIFRGGIGRVDFPDGDYDLEIASIRKILRLPGSVVIYPGHGPVTAVKDEIGNF